MNTIHHMHYAMAIHEQILEAQAAIHPTRVQTLRVKLEVAENRAANGKTYGYPKMVAEAEADAAKWRREIADLEMAEQEALAHEYADGPRAELERRLPIATEMALHGDPLPYPFPATRVMFIKLIREINKALTEPSPLDYGSAAWLAGVDDSDLGEAPFDTRRDVGV